MCNIGLPDSGQETRTPRKWSVGLERYGMRTKIRSFMSHAPLTGNKIMLAVMHSPIQSWCGCGSSTAGFSELSDFYRNATVDVSKAHNVVFAQIFATLHFNHYKVDNPWVDQAVGAARFDERRFIGV